jgi:hypothetical protein
MMETKGISLCETCLAGVYPPATGAGRKDGLWICSNPDLNTCPPGHLMFEIKPVTKCERYVSLTSRLVMTPKGGLVWTERSEIEKNEETI